MPAILADDHALEVWLEGKVADALEVVAPFDAARTTVVAVSAAVNRATFDDPSCIVPIAAPPASLTLDLGT
jgi:putative SOS response-associated peptidase YedK